MAEGSTHRVQISYYTPLQKVVPGTARDVKSAPLLFKPLKVRDMGIPNRIVVSDGTYISITKANDDDHSCHPCVNIPQTVVI